MVLGSRFCPAQDSLLHYDETEYIFEAPSSWKRDHRGVEPLFYLPDSTSERSSTFSILPESLQEGEELRTFVDDHFQLSINLWRNYGSEVTLFEDTTVTINEKPLIRQTLYLQDFAQYKVQWFIQADRVVYILELTATDALLERYMMLATDVVASFQLKER